MVRLHFNSFFGKLILDVRRPMAAIEYDGTTPDLKILRVPFHSWYVRVCDLKKLESSKRIYTILESDIFGRKTSGKIISCCTAPISEVEMLNRLSNSAFTPSDI